MLHLYSSHQCASKVLAGTENGFIWCFTNVQPSKDTAGKDKKCCTRLSGNKHFSGWLTVACLPRGPAESSDHTAATATFA